MAEGKIRNKIITVSGEPVTGKSTTVKAIKEKLINKGYKDEDIHIIKTGHEFRDYFKSIIDFIKNENNEKALKEISERDEIRSILDNAKYRELFIKELAKLKKSNFEIKDNLSVEQSNNIPQLKGIREVIDTIIDENVKNMGIEINSSEKPNEVWIIDSRLAFSNIPDSFSVRLTCRSDVAGKRLFEDSSRGKEDSNYNSIQDAEMQREKRRIGEINRYKKRYGIDLSDESNYDLVIDTSYSSIEDISDTILVCMDENQKGKIITKNWISPNVFIPTQSIRETGGVSPAGNSYEDIKKSIQNNGLDPKKGIEAVQVNGVLYLMDGHHRNFAAASAGKTLVPYKIIAKDDECVPGGKNPARAYARCFEGYLYDHEDIIADAEYKRSGERFSYGSIYPEIEKKMDEYSQNMSGFYGRFD